LTPKPPRASANNSAPSLRRFSDVPSLTDWAHRILPLKNQLTNADALAIESAFAGKLNEQDQSNCNSSSEYRREDSDNASVSLTASENNVVVIAKSVRERDRQHLKFVSTQPCLVCGRTLTRII
jgi:hypothetical protein